MDNPRRIACQTRNMFGWNYAILVFGAGMLVLGLLMTWFSLVWQLKTGPRTYVPTVVAVPEFYYFSLSALVLGLVLCIVLFVKALIRWICATRFSLSDLIVLVLCLGLLAAACTNGVLEAENRLSTLLYPIALKFVLSAPKGMVSPWGDPAFDLGLNEFQLAVALIFLIGVWARIPAASRILKFAFLAFCLAPPLAWGVLKWSTALSFFAVPAIMIFGLASQENAVSRSFVKPVKSARRSRLPDTIVA